MTVNVSIFYQNWGVTSSNVSYSNARNHYCMTSVLLPLRPILRLRKNSEHYEKLVWFFLAAT